MLLGGSQVRRMAFVVPPEADRVLISVNPKAGRGWGSRRVVRLEQLLRRHGFQVERSTDLAEVSGRANQLHAQRQLRALVGVGGDGTAAELVNRTQPGVPLTLLAAGTSNLLSNYLGLPRSPEKLCQTIAAGNCLRLDAGVASGRVFLLMASCGLDADVVQQVHSRRERGHGGGHISYLTYIKPLLESIRSYEYPEMRVYCDEQCDAPGGDQSPTVVARWVFALNLPRYGWGLPLAPKADPTDGLLELFTFRGGSFWRGLWYAAAAQLGWHHRMADCVTRRGRRFRITSDRQVSYQLDGDPGGFLPLEIEVLRGRLTVVVPASLGAVR